MLNNKGFAVSSVLYTLLVAFLLFLGAALAQLASSGSLIGKANDDIINGTKFEAKQVRGQGACTFDTKWYQSRVNGETVDNSTIIQINTRYGRYYWPKDFNDKIEGDILTHNGEVLNPGDSFTSFDGKVKYTFSIVTETLDFGDIELWHFVFNVPNDGDDTIDVSLYDICK